MAPPAGSSRARSGLMPWRSSFQASSFSSDVRAAAVRRHQLAPRRAAGEGCVRPPAEVADHEQEHHHHRAGVDEHLRGRDELGRRQQEQDGERGEVPDQRQRGVERVREGDDGDAGAEAGERGEDPHRPDERVPHYAEVL